MPSFYALFFASSVPKRIGLLPSETRNEKEKESKKFKKSWRLFKAAKTPNYDHIRRALKGDMLRWADDHRSWIEEGVYFDNKTLDEWINLKFNPGDSTALYLSANKKPVQSRG